MDGYLIQKSTRPSKKYMIRYNDKIIHFGSSIHNQYRDSTHLKLYSHLDHNDENRKRLYYLRHKKSNDKSSAKYWSNRFLWS